MKLLFSIDGSFASHALSRIVAVRGPLPLGLLLGHSRLLLLLSLLLLAALRRRSGRGFAAFLRLLSRRASLELTSHRLRLGNHLRGKSAHAAIGSRTRKTNN